jgi:hypothetical protein
MKTQTRILKPETYGRFSVENAAGIFFVVSAVSAKHAENKFRREYPGTTVTAIVRKE